MRRTVGATGEGRSRNGGARLRSRWTPRRRKPWEISRIQGRPGNPKASLGKSIHMTFPIRAKARPSHMASMIWDTTKHGSVSASAVTRPSLQSPRFDVGGNHWVVVVTDEQHDC